MSNVGLWNKSLKWEDSNKIISDLQALKKKLTKPFRPAALFSSLFFLPCSSGWWLEEDSAGFIDSISVQQIKVLKGKIRDVFAACCSKDLPKWLLQIFRFWWQCCSCGRLLIIFLSSACPSMSQEDRINAFFPLFFFVVCRSNQGYGVTFQHGCHCWRKHCLALSGISWSFTRYRVYLVI